MPPSTQLLRTLAAACVMAIVAGASTTPTSTGSNAPTASSTVAPSPVAAGGTISTVAGDGTAGFSGDGGQATSASLNGPMGLAETSSGAFIIVDAGNSRIRLVLPSGFISTIAGNGAAGYNGDGGQATSAALSPTSAAMTFSGAVLIADRGNNRVRLVLPSGIISTFAGNGAASFGGDGGQATSASLNNPFGVAVTPTGGVVVSDVFNNRVRLVLPSGIISTIAGNGDSTHSGDGGQATSAGIYLPHGIAVTPAGGILICEFGSHRVRLVLPSGVISTVAGSGAGAYGGDGGQAAAASLQYPTAVAATLTSILISDSENHRVRQVLPSGIISTIAGNGVCAFGDDGVPATSGHLCHPEGIAVTSTGGIVIADVRNNRIRVIAPLIAPTPTASPTPSTTPYCSPALFRSLPRMDLVGTLVGTALSPGISVLQPSEASCRQACCDAAACDGYAFSSGDLAMGLATIGGASCYLYVNITQLMPSSGYSSGVLLSTL